MKIPLLIGLYGIETSPLSPDWQAAFLLIGLYGIETLFWECFLCSHLSLLIGLYGIETEDNQRRDTHVRSLLIGLYGIETLAVFEFQRTCARF